MGLVLIGMSVAVILAFPIAGQFIVRHGSVRMTLARRPRRRARGQPRRSSRRTRCSSPLALFVLGASNATMDVSMNATASSVERDLGRPIMSSLHAGWSFGGVFGAGFAAGLAALERRPAHHGRAVVGAAAASSCSPARRGSARARRPRARTRPASRCPSRGVLLLAILCLLVMVTEGAMADWGGLYLRERPRRERRRRRAGVRRLLRPA